jgi:hypothetical protein
MHHQYTIAWGHTGVLLWVVHSLWHWWHWWHCAPHILQHVSQCIFLCFWFLHYIVSSSVREGEIFLQGTWRCLNRLLVSHPTASCIQWCMVASPHTWSTVPACWACPSDFIKLASKVFSPLDFFSAHFSTASKQELPLWRGYESLCLLLQLSSIFAMVTMMNELENTELNYWLRDKIQAWILLVSNLFTLLLSTTQSRMTCEHAHKTKLTPYHLQAKYQQTKRGLSWKYCIPSTATVVARY